MADLSGATRLLPIIGDPITFVESPARLTRTLAARGLDAACVPLHVREADLDTVMAALTAARNVDGILVTMPHKFAAFAWCSTASDVASTLGAVSILRRSLDGTWHGDMLDGRAFVKAQADRGARVDGSRALLVGAGGAGSAIAFALLDAGVRELVVHDADPARTRGLLNLVPPPGRARTSPGPADPTGCDLVLNATPMGMADGDPLPVDPARLTTAMFVGDVVAGHGATPLIRAAQATGCKTAGGGDMVLAAQDVMADFLAGAEPLA